MSKHTSRTLQLCLSALLALPLAASAADALWSNPNPVEPTAGRWSKVSFPDPAAYMLPAPPANDSASTRADLEELHRLAANRSQGDRKEIDFWARDMISPDSHWAAAAERMIVKYQLTHPAAARVHALLAGAIDTTMVATFNVKYKYLRPRPTHLDPTLKLPENFGVPAHPSYPSGHSAVSGAAKTILSEIFPQEAPLFQAMAHEAGMSRLKAGIHYRTDMEDGDRFGALIAKDILKANQKIRFDRVPEGKGGH